MKLDFHSHILPALDDGATCIEDSILLAEALKDWGFERVTCTPHITNLHPNTPDTIKPAFEQLQEALAVSGIDLDIRMSAEYRLVPQTWPEVLEKNWLMPIEDRFILMELPISKPEQMGQISTSSIETVSSATPAGGAKVHTSLCTTPFLSPQATSTNAKKRYMTKLFLTY